MYSTESVSLCVFVNIPSHLRSLSFPNAGHCWSVFPEDSDQLKGKDLMILTLALCLWGDSPKKKSQLPFSELHSQNSYVALCIYSLIKVKVTYSKLYIFRVKKLSFDICVLQWNYSHDLVNEYNHPPKNVLVPFHNLPSLALCHLLLSQATTNLLYVIIDSLEFSRILCTWNYTVCALFWSFIQHNYLKSIHAACINSSILVIAVKDFIVWVKHSLSIYRLTAISGSSNVSCLFRYFLIRLCLSYYWIVFPLYTPDKSTLGSICVCAGGGRKNGVERYI